MLSLCYYHLHNVAGLVYDHLIVPVPNVFFSTLDQIWRHAFFIIIIIIKLVHYSRHKQIKYTVIHCVSKNAPTLASPSFDKHRLILIIFGA